MSLDTLLCAARILQAQPGYTMPLVRLHAQLIRELGAQAGSYGQIYQALKKRTDSFAIVDAPRLLGIDGWPSTVREAYDAALNGAGLGSCVRVMLTETPVPAAEAGLLAALSTTLAELTICCGQDRTLTGYLEHVTIQVAELAQVIQGDAAIHPTIPLPGLPRAE